MAISLAANETAVLTAVKEGKMDFFDDGWKEDSNSWHDVFTDDVANLLKISPQAAGGVVSSMIQKGVFYSEGSGRDGSVWLTPEALLSV